MTNEIFQQLLDQASSVPASEIAKFVDTTIATHGDSMAHDQQMDLLYLEYLTRKSADDFRVVDDLRRRYPYFESAIMRQIQVDTEFLRWDETTEAMPNTKAIEPHQDKSRTSIGDYMVLEKIGEGAQAEVFRVLHPMLRCELALKVSKHRTEKAVHVLDEGRILMNVNDPGVARVIDAGIWEGRPFIVSELIRGVTMKKRVEQNSLTRQQLVEFVASLSRTISKLHDQGITHCDIKPTNVLFDPNGQPKLIDFGMAIDHSTEAWDAHYIHRDAHTGGTLAYMAPELLTNARRQVGPGRDRDVRPSRGSSGDVFSLGGLLFFGLIGRHPYSSKSSREILDAIATGNWDRLALKKSEVPQALQKACEQAMATRPEERTQSAKLLADSLESWLIRSRQSTVRRRALLAILCFALLGACWQVWPRGPTDQVARLAVSSPSTVLDERFDNLDIKVWAEDRMFELVDRVPVQLGEHIQINAPLRANHHGALWMLSSDGQANQLAEFEPQIESRWVHFPAELEEAVPLVGPAGTEAIVWIESRNSISRQEVGRTLGEPDRWPAMGESSLFHLVDGKLQVVQDLRAIGQAEGVESPDAVIQKHMRTAALKLQMQGNHVEILAFSHTE